METAGAVVHAEVAVVQAPVVEVTLSLFVLVAIIIFHGTAMRWVTRRHSKTWVRVNVSTPLWQVNGMIATVIASLALVHLAETAIWAVPVAALGMLPNLRDSYFFVLESYTTLGSGEISLPDQWRLVGPMIAMSGLFTFGWTGSLMVSIMTDVGRLDRSQAKSEQDNSQQGG